MNIIDAPRVALCAYGKTKARAIIGGACKKVISRAEASGTDVV